MITKYDIIEKYPKYEKMTALDKILFEDSHNVRGAKIRRFVEMPLEAILTIGVPVGLYFLAKNGVVHEPNAITYGLNALVGFVVGRTLGMAIGTSIYETIAKDGEINEFCNAVKKYVTKSSI